MKAVGFVRVDWIDSTTNGGWTPSSAVSATSPTEITSVGLLLEKNKDRVILAQSLSTSTQEVCNLLTVPRMNVRRIVKLK